MKSVLAALLSLLCMSTWTLADWERLPPLPKPNGGFACGFIQGKLVIAGGTNWQNEEKGWLSVIRSYDPQTQQWSELGKLPNAWAYGACGVIRDRLILAGGSDGKGALRDVLSVDGSSQCQRLGELPKGVIYSCSAVQDEQLVMGGGGTDPVDLSTLASDAFSIGFNDSWQAKVAVLPKLGDIGFGIGSAAAAKGQVFIFGGAQHDPVNLVKNLDTLRVIGSSTSAHLPVAIRGMTAAALNNHLIYLAGGYPSDELGFTDAAWLFDATAQTFAKAKPLPIKSMVHLATDGQWLYVIGGEDRKKHRSDGAWRIRVKELLPAK